MGGHCESSTDLQLYRRTYRQTIHSRFTFLVIETLPGPRDTAVRHHDRHDSYVVTFTTKRRTHTVECVWGVVASSSELTRQASRSHMLTIRTHSRCWSSLQITDITDVSGPRPAPARPYQVSYFIEGRGVIVFGQGPEAMAPCPSYARAASAPPRRQPPEGAGLSHITGVAPHVAC